MAEEAEVTRAVFLSTLNIHETEQGYTLTIRVISGPQGDSYTLGTRRHEILYDASAGVGVRRSYSL